MSTFSVSPNQIAVLGAAGMFEGESYKVFRLMCTACDSNDEKWEEYSPKGETVTITNKVNPVVIDLPGTYKVEPDGQHNCESMICVDTYYTCCGA